ncbi:MAG: PEP-CTERM sorting domain-containing protein [Candidatus Brocadiia bacterium]|nr:MAG: PEP-CTERM sorting domain-containing protein [Candidatus Brocadiia bacterium]
MLDYLRGTAAQFCGSPFLFRVPETAMLLLLGLGAVMLRRKR